MTLTFTSETLPSDHKAAIRQMKRELRAQIGDVQGVFDRLSARIASRVAEINTLKRNGDPVWPVIPFADVQSGNISPEQREAVKRRGCAVIKGHFPREKALAWDNAMLDYLDLNRFDDVYKGPGITSLAPLPPPARRSIRSTGHTPRWRPARAKRWLRCSRS